MDERFLSQRSASSRRSFISNEARLSHGLTKSLDAPAVPHSRGESELYFYEDSSNNKYQERHSGPSSGYQLHENSKNSKAGYDEYDSNQYYEQHMYVREQAQHQQRYEEHQNQHGYPALTKNTHWHSSRQKPISKSKKMWGVDCAHDQRQEYKTNEDGYVHQRHYYDDNNANGHSNNNNNKSECDNVLNYGADNSSEQNDSYYASSEQYYYEQQHSSLPAYGHQQQQQQQHSYVPDIFSLTRHGRYEAVEALLDSGIPVDIRDHNGNTVLLIASQNGLKRIAKLALRRGADINVQNYHGNTPLHYCYVYNFGETLGSYLVSKGANPLLKNREGLLCHELTLSNN